MARMNGKLADTRASKEALEDDIFNLQGKLDQAAKVHMPLPACADLLLPLEVAAGAISPYALGQTLKAPSEASVC